jgi:hypothetical protein
MLTRKVLGLIVAATLALAAPTAASADVVIDWNRYAETAINQGEQQRQQPTAALLDSAMVQGAVYDAVNAITGTNQPYPPHVVSAYTRVGRDTMSAA